MKCTLYNNRILQYNNAELPSGSAFFLSVFSPEKVVFFGIKNWEKLYFGYEIFGKSCIFAIKILGKCYIGRYNKL